jgi:hypothetical protein
MTARSDADQGKKVEISEDYLVFLHDELANNQKRLKELLGESQAKTIFALSADKLVTSVGPGRYATDPLEGIVQKLSSWGMEVSLNPKGNTTEIDIKCPYAESVHPRMSSEEPFCPLGEYILGAVRLEDSKSQLLHNKLTKDGVQLAVEKKS